jgi:hypothetical protein
MEEISFDFSHKIKIFNITELSSDSEISHFSKWDGQKGMQYGEQLILQDNFSLEGILKKV